MPGSGKSIIGDLLSKKIKKKFIDTDKIIEKNENMSIEDIFKIHGESYFRNLESNLVSKLEGSDDCIISTGGGMPIYFDNMSKLMNIGITIFIDVPLEELIKRAQSFNDRPLVTKDKADTLKILFNKRIGTYQNAHIVYKTQGKLPNEICDDIIKRIEDMKELNNNICK